MSKQTALLSYSFRQWFCLDWLISSKVLVSWKTSWYSDCNFRSRSVIFQTRVCRVWDNFPRGFHGQMQGTWLLDIVYDKRHSHHMSTSSHVISLRVRTITWAPSIGVICPRLVFLDASFYLAKHLKLVGFLPCPVFYISYIFLACKAYIFGAML